MIVTLTPNPSVDRALDVDSLAVGEVNRAVAAHEHAGGKGINVSRALVHQGVPSLAVLPAGGADGARLAALLAEVAVATVAVAVHGDTRSNVTLVDARGVTTKINAPGPELTRDEVDALVDAVEQQAATGPRWLVGAGSLPPGAGPDLFVRVAEVAARHGVPVALDTSGAPLAAAVHAGGLALVKPNDDELAELVGRDLVTVGDVVDAAREVLAHGNDAVLVSLGAHGALLVTPQACLWAGGAPLVPLSTVGAGDSTLAGYLATDGPPADRLRLAVAWGRAAVLLPGSAVPEPSDVAAVIDDVRVIDQPDPTLALKEL
jgi:1-phosphofructokinase